MRFSPAVRQGELVRVRQHRWRVVDVRSFDECRVLTLLGVGAGNANVSRSVVAPFDEVETIDRPGRVRFAGGRRWRVACGKAVAAAGSPSALRTVAGADIDLMPHQLEPALAVLGGRGSRVLIADEVGLGKTIQAGVIVSELAARGAADRVLVLTPAGLREQWAQELALRFRIEATVVDFRAMRQRLATLPFGVNPWSTWPVAIASIDFVKRTDVLRGVVSCPWDIVIVDEAHGVASDSDRHAAAEALTSTASHVLLLTATPHNGDRRAFESLCRLGSHGDNLLVFRRTRDAVRGGSGRHVHRTFVGPNDAELRMHLLLDQFTAAVWNERGELGRDGWLALAVLHKRALSSAHSLARSVERRLASLSSNAADAQQLMLPLDDRGEHDPADDTPGWSEVLALKDADCERRLLTALASSANAAASRESKIGALGRLLQRINEPAIVFTEYRDTLQHLALALGRPAATVHGGMSREERSAAVHAFVSGARRLLLATDAAAEGLNLHHTCRTVINLELPWNPVRLEQRIGRVDRIGQSRTVHAFHLIARGTAELRVLERLRLRLGRARTDIGAADPIGDTVTAAVVDKVMTTVPDPVGGIPLQSMRREALAEIDRLIRARGLRLRCSTGLSRLRSPEKSACLCDFSQRGSVRLQAEAGRDVDVKIALGEDDVLALRTHRRTTRGILGARALLVFRVVIEDSTGTVVGSNVIPVAVRLRTTADAPAARESLESFLAVVSADAGHHAQAACALWSLHALKEARTFVEARLRRERSIAERFVEGPAHVQPGLFDRRADTAHALALAVQRETAARGAARIARLEHAANVVVQPPQLLLVLLPSR